MNSTNMKNYYLNVNKTVESTCLILNTKNVKESEKENSSTPDHFLLSFEKILTELSSTSCHSNHNHKFYLKL